MDQHEVVVLAGVRTPIGAFQGSLASLTAPQLGAIAIREALVRAGVPGADLDEVLMGCVLTGGMGQAPARQASLGAGVPVCVPCTTVNKVCGSAMKATIMGMQAIRCGDAKVLVTGGMESMSNAPYALDKARTGYRMGHGSLLDLMIHDGLWDPYGKVHMGNCGDKAAAQFGFTRAELDAYAAESYRRALDAQSAGRLAEEIVPVQVPQRKGDPLVVAEDEEPKKGNPEKLPSLKPAFGAEGVTTAGNASSINDGAAAMVIASAEYAQQKGLKPLAKLRTHATHARQPDEFPIAPAYAIQALLDKAGLTVADIAIFEVNEAFSVVPLAVAKQLGISLDKLNVNGGAVALGHPIGMSAGRIMISAVHQLRRSGGRFAIASPCIGGGEATAVLVESV